MVDRRDGVAGQAEVDPRGSGCPRTLAQRGSRRVDRDPCQVQPEPQLRGPGARRGILRLDSDLPVEARKPVEPERREAGRADVPPDLEGPPPAVQIALPGERQRHSLDAPAAIRSDGVAPELDGEVAVRERPATRQPCDGQIAQRRRRGRPHRPQVGGTPERDGERDARGEGASDVARCHADRTRQRERRLLLEQRHRLRERAAHGAVEGHRRSAALAARTPHGRVDELETTDRAARDAKAQAALGEGAGSRNAGRR